MTDVKATSAPVSQRALSEIMEAAADAMAQLSKRLAALEKRVNEVETRGLEYRGTWSRAASYRRGQIVTDKGGLWIAAKDTTDKPGDSPAWQLAAKGTK